MIKIGLEIHGYIDTKEKLFCSCASVHGAKLTKPNVNICPICTGQPGAKPMAPNKEAIKKSIQVALILGCKVGASGRAGGELAWQRKHYSWPDLPKGYQNTLSGPHASPIGEKGKFLGINIKECHLEEDPAAWNPQTGEIDYNRSGIPLIEIVTEPEFKNSEQVEKWLRELIITLGYVKALNRESGIKADVNVSIKKSNYKKFEIKNVNSIVNIKNAIDSEIQRQESLKEFPKEQETRMYDPVKKITKKMRSKEEAQDYRFVSDPDLPKIILKDTRINSLKKTIPETPTKKLERLIKKHKIPKRSAEILTKNIDVIELFEKTIKEIDSKLAIRWVSEELFSVLNHNKKKLDEISLDPVHFISLLKLIEKRTLSEPKAREILRSWKEESSPPDKNIKMHEQISDDKEIEKAVSKIIKENPDAVKDYQSGKEGTINFLMGKVMHATNKRADYNLAKKILEDKLK
ncbi:MAG: Asp-tRNA(Asn)/Glu-tRNA(Gln) amidotransferase subunit GatB [Nanoarchaeota archaeon]|nr:Asp-tRNA(Asn)/Glu-tRNA(Gln) amidotransferase subunit GatB [Nanoarchaeota archaeon]